MFDAPLDAWYAWLGLGAVSVVALGIGLALASPPPESAVRVANAVDAVAASPHEAVRRVRLEADQIALEPWEIGLRTSGGSAFAPVTYGPITPVDGERLRAVLAGRSPAAHFRTTASFRDALRRARNRTGNWEPAPARLTVRRVVWGGIDATLVG
jgi:hypothetical protein